MKKILITSAEGNEAKEIGRYTMPSFVKYASVFGYDVELIKRYNDLHPSWQKVPAFLEYLQKYDVVLWIDIDAIIVKFDEDISNVFNHTIGFQAIACEPTTPNMGVWLVKKCDQSLQFLNKVQRISPAFKTPCWEQDAVHAVLNYKRGDQYDINDIRNTILLQEKWNNVHFKQMDDETIIYHFAGRTIEEKLKGVKGCTRYML